MCHVQRGCTYTLHLHHWLVHGNLLPVHSRAIFLVRRIKSLFFSLCIPRLTSHKYNEHAMSFLLAGCCCCCYNTAMNIRKIVLNIIIASLVFCSLELHMKVYFSIYIGMMMVWGFFGAVYIGRACRNLISSLFVFPACT